MFHISGVRVRVRVKVRVRVRVRAKFRVMIRFRVRVRVRVRVSIPWKRMSIVEPHFHRMKTWMDILIVTPFSMPYMSQNNSHS